MCVEPNEERSFSNKSLFEDQVWTMEHVNKAT